MFVVIVLHFFPDWSRRSLNHYHLTGYINTFYLLQTVRHWWFHIYLFSICILQLRCFSLFLLKSCFQITPWLAIQMTCLLCRCNLNTTYLLINSFLINQMLCDINCITVMWFDGLCIAILSYCSCLTNVLKLVFFHL